MMGYTISPLDSNESILEKLNKLEKYLKDNKMYNLYTTSFEFYDNTTDFIPDAAIDNPGLNTIAEGDLAIYKYNGATIVGVIIAVGSGGITVSRSTEQVLADDTLISSVDIVTVSTNTFKIQITDTKGHVYESGTYTVSGGGSGISTIQVNESLGSATIVITDTDNVQHTSNSFTVGEQNTDTLISTIQVNESSGTAQIVITDTANHTYTSNSFNVGGGGGGSETVYVDANNNIVSNNISSIAAGVSNTVLLGKSATINSNSTYSVVIGYSATASVNSNDTVVIGSQAGGSSDNVVAIGSQAYSNAQYGIAIGALAEAQASKSVQIGGGANTTPNSIQYLGHQIVAEENGTLKLSNELQLNNHLITIISMTNDFATASANGIKVTVDQDDSTHEQVQNLNHPTTDTSIINDEQILAIYNYTNMTDPDNPVSEFTLCYAMFTNYDSVNNVCDCMLLRMGPTQTM